MFIVASIPLWLLSAIFLAAAFVPFTKRRKTTDKDAKAVLYGLLGSAALAFLAAFVCHL
jgi:hypothetical protein